MIKLFELFAGYGSQSLALKRLGIEFENVGYCEIDKYAIQAHKALHGEDIPNFGDITKVDAEGLPDMDFLTYSFPCQDISVAGKGMGLSKDSGTRSSLLWECHKIIAAKKPKYLMMENVKNLVGKKNLPDFQAWVNELRELGYNNYYKVINAKDCGVPQNRERVFCVSIRRDADEGTFRFNEPFDNGVRLKDLLEGEVEEKFYIADEKVEKLITQLKEKNQEISYCVDANYYKGTTPEQFLEKSRRQLVAVPEPAILRPERTEYGKKIRKQYELGEIKESRHNMRELKPRTDGVSNTLTTVLKDNLLAVPCIAPDRLEKKQNGRRFKEDGEPMFTLTGQDRHGVLVNECKRIGNVYGEQFGTGYAGNVWDKNGISPALMTMQGGGRQPHVLCLNSKDSNGKQPPQSQRVYDENGLMVTIDVGTNGRFNVLTNYRIRKLTPKECFRLMGLTDEEIQKIQDAGISNSQQYKMAGNSIVVDQMFFLKNLLTCEFKEDEEQIKFA